MIKTVSEMNVSVEVKALEALRHELFETRNSIEYAEVKLDKAEMLLNRWVQDYSFAKKPDPRAAVACWSGSDKSQEAEQAAKWFWDYNQIFTIVDIAFDYLLEAKKILNEAVEREVKSIEKASDRNS